MSLRPERPRVAVVVPVLGQDETLRPLCERIGDALGTEAFEIVLVDDCGPPTTWDRIRSLRDELPSVRAERLAVRHGGVGARAVGAALTDAPLVVTIDADLQYAPEDIVGLVDALDAGADLVSGVRAHQDGRPWHRRLASPAIRVLGLHALGIAPTDFGCGLKAWRAELGDRALRWDGPGGELRFAVALHRLAERYREVPVRWERGDGPSTYSDRARLRMAVQLAAADPRLDRLRGRRGAERIGRIHRRREPAT